MFEAANPGTKLQFNFAASGALLQQIDKGAPVDVFASADQETMDQAQTKGLVRAAQRRNFVSNALVVIVPTTSANVPKAVGDLTPRGLPARGDRRARQRARGSLHQGRARSGRACGQRSSRR